MNFTNFKNFVKFANFYEFRKIREFLRILNTEVTKSQSVDNTNLRQKDFRR